MQELCDMFSGIAEKEIQFQVMMDEFVNGFGLNSQNPMEKKMMEAFFQNYQMQIKQRKKIGQLIQFRICNPLKTFIAEEKEKSAHLKSSLTQAIKSIADIAKEVDQLKSKCLDIMKNYEKKDFNKQIEACKEFDDERISANRSIGLLYQARINELIAELKKSERRRIDMLSSMLDAFAKIQAEISESTGSFTEKMTKIVPGVDLSEDLSYLDSIVDTQCKDLSKASYIPYDLPIQLERAAFLSSREFKAILAQDASKKPVLARENSNKNNKSNEPIMLASLPISPQPKDFILNPSKSPSSEKSSNIRTNLLLPSQKSQEVITEVIQNQPQSEVNIQKKERPAVKPKDFRIDESGNVLKLNPSEEVINKEMKFVKQSPPSSSQLEKGYTSNLSSLKIKNAVRVMVPVPSPQESRSIV
jgi:hypothetical protein